MTLVKPYMSSYRKSFPDSTFLADPQHSPVVFQGEQWRAKGNLFQTIMGIIIFGAILLSLIDVLGSDYQQNIALPEQLRETGALAQANIVNVRSKFVQGSYTGRSRTPDRTYYYALYEFHLEENGKPRKYTGEYQISDSGFIQVTRALFHGEKMRYIPIEVMYLRDNPQISLPKELVYRDPANATSSMLCITVPLIVFFVVLIAAFVYVKWRDLRLSNAGYLIEGQIMSAEWTTVGKHMGIALHYTFISPEGETLSRTQTVTRHDVTELPKPNTSVAILYVDKRCFQMM